MAKATTTNNYLQIVPNDFVKLFVDLYSKQKEFNKLPAIMLWGQPGVGKSQAVHEAGRRLGEMLGKKVNTTVASLLMMSPIDLRGIPAKATNDKGEDIARWLEPEIFHMDDSDDVINILFLDEISAAPPSVQASAYQICLDRRVGEHHFPKNCIVIAAGNRTTDKAVAYKMPKPLGNRMTHFEMVPSVEDWKKWAYNNNIDSRIIAFINYDNRYLCRFDPQNDEVAFATPRSWELVNSYLQLDKEHAFEKYFSCVAGTVGLGVAQEFRAYVNVYEKLPDFKSIATGARKECQKNIQNKPDVMFALATMISSRCVSLANKVDITNKESVAKLDTVITNCVRFVNTIEKKEYVTLFAKDMFGSLSDSTRGLFVNNSECSDLIMEIGENFL